MEAKLQNMSQVTQDRIVVYDVVRVIATLLVVIGHSTYYQITTPYGGCDYSVFFSGLSVLYKVMISIVKVIYSFHMPLYMMLSGALFYHTRLKETMRGG